MGVVDLVEVVGASPLDVCDCEPPGLAYCGCYYLDEANCLAGFGGRKMVCTPILRMAFIST